MQHDIFGLETNGNQGYIYKPLMRWKSRNSSIFPLRKQIILEMKIKYSDLSECPLKEAAPPQRFRVVVSGIHSALRSWTEKPGSIMTSFPLDKRPMCCSWWVMGWWLDEMVSVVFSNINDPVIQDTSGPYVTQMYMTPCSEMFHALMICVPLKIAFCSWSSGW